MDIKESSQMTADEEYSHWWMRTRFYFLNKIVTPFLREKKALRILEIGSGTGQNLRYFLSEHCLKNQIQEIVGVDTALQNKVQKYFWNSSVQCTGYQSLEDVSFSEKFDLIVLMDVVEHLDEPVALLKKWKAYLKTDGIVYITVPAMKILWSEHDVYLGHKRRYDLKLLQSTLAEAGFQTLDSRYFFFHIMPVVYVMRRLLSRFFMQKEVASDLQKTNYFVNLLLLGLGKLESFFGGNRIVGTSVFGVFRG